MRTEERDLLVRAKVLLECVDTASLQDQADLIVKEIQAILAQHEQEPSSDDFMYNKLKESYDELVESSFKDFQRGYGAALAHAIYVKEPTRKPLSDESICEILLRKEWKGFVDLVRMIEKAHGIGVDDE